MIDKPLLKRRFAAALPGYDAHAAVQNEICIRLDEMIGRIRILPVDRAMEIGAGTGFLTRLLLKRFPDAQWMLNDMIETTEEYLKPYAAGRTVAYMWGDAEQLPLPIGTDLLASASTVQWFDDVPAFMKDWIRETNIEAATVKEIFEKIAANHIRFERIHPFADGNGRTGRMIINQQLINNGLLPVSIRPTGKYREAFRRYDKREDLSEMVYVLLRSELESFDRVRSLALKLSKDREKQKKEMKHIQNR